MKFYRWDTYQTAIEILKLLYTHKQPMYIRQIYKKVKFKTYNAVMNVIRELEKEGLVISKEVEYQQGKPRYVEITQKGIQYLKRNMQLISELQALYSDNNAQQKAKINN